MSKHMDEPAKRSKKPAMAVAALIVALVVAGAAWALVGRNGNETPQPTAPAQDENKGGDSDNSGSTPTGDDANAPDLPFSLDGVTVNGELLETDGNAQDAALTNTWSFGGDYSSIGSVPISSETVFGSTTSSPDDVYSYSAALISKDSVKAIEAAQSGEKYFEPQDGTGTEERLVWKSSELTNLPSTNTDNWRVSTWDSASGASKILGSAEKLNGTDQTPLLDGEIVPTCNAKTAFFASESKSDGDWLPQVLAYALDGIEDQDATVVGSGSYPSATDDGCIWAGDVSSVDSGAFVFSALYAWNGNESTKVFSISSSSGTWTISGAWTCGDRRVVSFSSDGADNGAYIGIWNADFSSCVGWVHAKSPRVVGSMNSDYFVWGSGSEADDPDMYALKLGDMSLSKLGSALGYSRPSIAQACNTVLVPSTDGYNPATFTVGDLS